MRKDDLFRTNNRANCSLHHQPWPSLHAPEAQLVEMENLQEFIPFAREMLSQKPSRGLLKVYLVGSIFAVLGTVIGLVETVCQPFCSSEQMDAEMLLMLAKERRTLEADSLNREERKKEEEEAEETVVSENEAAALNKILSKSQGFSQRNISNRLHAS